MLLLFQTSLRLSRSKKVPLAGLKIEDILATYYFILRQVSVIYSIVLDFRHAMYLAQIGVFYQVLHSLLDLL